ncbi:uncharacterized protein LY89DRAFT_692339 [Mollisia scopiformis]|uniref:Uncharacterized protein n=1 Tax=Mollisia scopiformis TaxID=149040 RepID=A0A132B2W7_MOLSC|nr:uncharacterized protein LY89DRAFT_692339 [Mollisia scopiformis]KUJ06732.1 hypothetical protein LY89DRAFT_692339 [Mollisia scopiformis]
MTKEALGASSVYVYDWRYRKGGTTYDDRNLEEDIKNTRYVIYAPIGYVHSDYSYQGGLDRLFLHLTEPELESYKKQGARMRLINAWRPLRKVENAPLAMCDRRSVLPEDVIEVDKVLPNNLEVETCIYHRPYHKWYFMSEQTPDDVWLFVQWEECDVPCETTSVPHTALNGPQVRLGDMPRESLEVRMIVIS